MCDEDCHAWQAAQRRALIEWVRREWLGWGVWYMVPKPLGRAVPVFGEVAGIDEAGRVQVLIGYDASGQPLYQELDVTCLGTSRMPTG